MKWFSNVMGILLVCSLLANVAQAEDWPVPAEFLVASNWPVPAELTPAPPPVRSIVFDEPAFEIAMNDASSLTVGSTCAPGSACYLAAVPGVAAVRRAVQSVCTNCPGVVSSQTVTIEQPGDLTVSQVVSTERPQIVRRIFFRGRGLLGRLVSRRPGWIWRR